MLILAQQVVRLMLVMGSMGIFLAWADIIGSAMR